MRIAGDNDQSRCRRMVLRCLNHPWEKEERQEGESEAVHL